MILKFKNLLIIQSFLFCIQQVCLCGRVFKDQLHIISELSIRPDDQNSASDDWFLVDEYIDRENGVSSIKIFNYWDDVTKIYYNDLSQLKSLEYDELSHQCKHRTFYDMPLKKLRKILLHLLPNEKLNQKNIDIGIGPSGLIYAIEELLDRFYYIKTEYSEANLAYIDKYELITDSYESSQFVNDLLSDKRLVITLSILNKDNQKRKTGKDTLAEAVNAAAAAANSDNNNYNSGNNLDLLNILLCDNDIKDVETNKLKEIIKCPHDNLIADIDFQFITEILGDTLIGQDLDKSKDFNFNLEPFVQPIGIGCWDKDEGCLGEKKFSIPSLQFSAEYKTLNGSKGLSYVAFDGYRKILRLDRNDRKSIYDLDRMISYHIGKYNLFNNEKSDLLSRAHNCIAMNFDKKTINNNKMMEFLLGISKDKSACHLGSKIVDHIFYYVYEIELNYGNEQENNILPILLETSQFLLPNKFSPNKRFFITYYVEEFPNTPDVNGFGKFSEEAKDMDMINIPKFIELWEYTDNNNNNENKLNENINNNNSNSNKRLINRLEFTEFSWSLDVEPSGDPEAEKDLSHLFNINSCSNERSNQLQLRFRLSSFASELENSKKLSKTLKKNPQLIKELIHENLSKQLDIPRLNIIDLNIFKQNKVENSFIVDTKIVELHTGITYVDKLGYTKYLDIMDSLKVSILNIYSNRHSIDECRLDSLSESKKNTLMFCKGLTVCVLFNQDDLSAYIPNLTKKPSNFDNLISQDKKNLECLIEQFNWAQLIKNDKISVLKIVEDNYHRLIGGEVVIKFRYKEESSNNKSFAELIKFKGFTHAIELKSLDPEGLLNIKKALVGIRYTTMEEEPNCRNMNVAFKLNYFNHDVFKYCQLACQLDEFCASFSICSRKKNSIQPTDCILSTVRLTPARIKEIDKLIRNNSTSKDLLKYKVTTYDNSQELKFKPDSECNIHPKDILSTYKMSSLLRVKNEIPVQNNDNKSNSKKQQLGTITTLDDCANLDYEASQWNNLGRTNFSYCPMGSICILEDKDVYKLPNNQICYSYEKIHTQFFSKTSFTRMSIQLDSLSTDSDNEQSTNFISSDDNSSKKQQDMKTNDIARNIEGLTTEQCARDCNLMKSKCLAFDSCQFNNPARTICNLYSIRSPLNNNANKLLGYLENEKQFYNIDENGKITTRKQNSIKLYSSTECSHFYLKDVYFNIRLQQLLEPEPAAREIANNLELNLINEDQKNSDEILSNIIEESTNNNDNKNKNNVLNFNGDKSSGLGAVNVFLLFFGAICGSIGLIYGGQIVIYTSDLWDYVKARRSQRNMNHRISQLALANNQDI